MTPEQYYARVEEVLKDRPSWRRGQAHANVLREEFPQLSYVITGSPIDPFYIQDDDKEQLLRYLAWLERHWRNGA